MTNESIDEKKFSVYTNNISVSMSPYDVSIVIRQNTVDSVTELGVVNMSPQHAKVLVDILRVHLEQYEELFGKIPTIDQEKLARLEKQGVVHAG